MPNLFVMHRPGIVVVSGEVINIDINRGEVLIENNCYLPVSKINERRRCRFFLDRKKIESFDLKNKDFIMATVRPSMEMEILFDNGEDDTKEYATLGYHMRYTGSFDFDMRGKCPEEHVFRGKVLSSILKKTKSGNTCTSIKVSWRKNGSQVAKELICRGDITSRIDSNTTGIFVTGPSIQCNNKGFYMLKHYVI